MKLNLTKGLFLLFAVLACFVPFVANNYWLDVATTVMIFVVLAQGLNVVVGYAGLLDLGYAAFFAVGAYTTGVLMATFGWSFWLTLPVAFIFAALSGVIIGAPTLRLRSDYLAIVTLGFGEIVRIAANNMKITGAASGIYGIPHPKIGTFVLSTQTHFYYMILIIALVSIFAVYRLNDSRLGRAWKYIREDEDAAEAMGINRVHYKLLAFAIGAVIGSFAGSLFAVKMGAVSPLSFSFMQSVLILLAVVLGGMGSLAGVTIGAILIVVLPEVLRDIESWRYVIFGLALVLMMIYRPQGIWPDNSEQKKTKALPASGKPTDLSSS